MQTALTVAARRLPVEMTTPPFFRKVNPGDFPVLFISLNSPTLPMSTVDEYGQTVLAQQISQIARRRAGAGLWRPEIRRARPGRSGRGGGAQHLARGHPHRAREDQFEHAGRHASRASGRTSRCRRPRAISKAEDYSKVVVAYRNGAPVKLDEIANVIDSVENNRIASFFNGNRSVVLAIQRQPDANTVAVVDAVKDRIPALPGADSGLDQHGGDDGPVDLGARVGARRAGDAADRDRAGRAGDLPVPAHGLGHHHSGAGGADLADRAPAR